MMGLRRKKRNRWQCVMDEYNAAFADGLANPAIAPAVIDRIENVERLVGNYEGRRIFVVESQTFLEFKNGEWKECVD